MTDWKKVTKPRLTLMQTQGTRDYTSVDGRLATLCISNQNLGEMQMTSKLTPIAAKAYSVSSYLSALYYGQYEEEAEGT
ncbi:hypothetical protein EGR_07249 [Echinococcus granulosus]|uniref:Uncharacterized protein n=1 Tax=Echinococcus granulosus TaxID=6210 RepID=W6UIG2_ECHGR|nr:hypothetical protein EGR_07249 [Echinococcus granulosus]EUB57887.1 hypothetical protein EGR_07249 [Echinococcus granulosus]